VEDGKDNQLLISTILKKAGALVTIADNGQIGYELAIEAHRNHSPFDTILMDMQMPVLDGCGATAKLRKDGYRGAIVALTANAMPTDRTKCFEAGSDEFLTKPINVKSLIETAATYLRLAKRTPTNPPTQNLEPASTPDPTPSP
jgi:CheY-like chemotaxis protein